MRELRPGAWGFRVMSARGPFLGDTVRRTDQDWGDAELIGVVVHEDLSVEYRLRWPDVVAWVPEADVELVSPKPGGSGS